MKMKSMKSIQPCQSVVQIIYDIVMAHGGELKVETKSGNGLPFGEAFTEFTIMLPL
jgi:hypothetical protein